MAKIILQHIKGNSYFFSGRLSIGAYINNGVVVLIDSGIDRESAKAVDKAIREAGYTVGAIINTHHHPDHCGGNAYFQQQYPGCRVYATHFESLFIGTPYLQPVCFCGGAMPFTGIRNKFLEAAEASVVTDVITAYQDQTINIYGSDFSIITLPGHTHGSIGVISTDSVFYTGDSFFGEETFNKHGALYYTNITDTLLSFDKLATLTPDATVFYHGGELQGPIPPVIQQHQKRILDTMDDVLRLIREVPTGLAIDQLTQKIMQTYEIPANHVSWMLTRTNVNAMLAHLENTKQLTMKTDGALLRVVI